MLVAALMVSIGLHWAVLQSAAWVGMAVTYTVQTGSVAEGLSNTFDGDHACPLCHMVAEGTKSKAPASDERAPQKDGKEFKLTLAIVTVPAFVFGKLPAIHWPTETVHNVVRHERPVAPPPRALE